VTAPTLNDFPHLGFVPCPGDEDQAGDVARVVRGAAKALEDVDHVLRGAADGEWRGEAARAFRELLAHDFRPKLETAQRSFSEAATALEGWVTLMGTQQKAAASLEHEAATAAATLSSKQSHLSGLPPAPHPGEPEPSDAAGKKKAAQDAKDRTDAQTAVTNAQGALDDVRRRAHTLHDQYQRDGGDVAAKLKHAMDEAPGKPGFFDRIGQAIGGMLDDIGKLADSFADWAVKELAKIAPLLKVIGDIAGLASTVLGLLSLIPGLQFLALPALILGGVALVSHYLMAVGESGSFLKALTNPTVIMDAVTLAFGAGAFTASMKLAKLAGEGGTFGQMALKSMKPFAEMEAPPSYFKLATGASYDMSTAEFGLRAARFHCTWGGNVMVAMGAKANVQMVKDWFHGKGLGPLTNNSPIATPS
jgi:hypothetical protein